MFRFFPAIPVDQPPSDLGGQLYVPVFQRFDPSAGRMVRFWHTSVVVGRLQQPT